MHILSLALGYTLVVGQLQGLHVGAIPADLRKPLQNIGGRNVATRYGVVGSAGFKRLDTGPGAKPPTTPPILEPETNRPSAEQNSEHGVGPLSGTKEPGAENIHTNCRIAKRSEGTVTAERMDKFWKWMAEYLSDKADKDDDAITTPIKINIWGAYSSAKLEGGDESQFFESGKFSYAEGTTEDQINKIREARAQYVKSEGGVTHTRLLRSDGLTQYNKHDGKIVDFGFRSKQTHILQIRHGSPLLDLAEQMENIDFVDEHRPVTMTEKRNAAVQLHELTAGKGDVGREQLTTVLKAMKLKDEKISDILEYTPDLVLQGKKPEWQDGYARDVLDNTREMPGEKGLEACE